jgi:16S rRNA C1402 (ribose-2'-O) methylase RsmI
VIAGAGEAETPSLETSVSEARELVAAGMKKRDAAHAIAERHGLSANQVYRELMNEAPAAHVEERRSD